MGWFEDKDGLTLGDTPLDDLRGCLQGVAREYQEAMQRPPTLAELAATLRTVLRGMDEAEVVGLDTAEVIDVILKTKKKPKKGTVATGDTFAARLPDGSYAFGRVLYFDKAHSNTLAEFFRYRSRQPLLPNHALSLGRLTPPISVGLRQSFESKRWAILDHSPNYRAPDHDQIRQYSGVSAPFHVFDAEFKTVDRAAPEKPANAMDMDRFFLSQPEKLETYLLEELEKAGL